MKGVFFSCYLPYVISSPTVMSKNNYLSAIQASHTKLTLTLSKLSRFWSSSTKHVSQIPVLEFIFVRHLCCVMCYEGLTIIPTSVSDSVLSLQEAEHVAYLNMDSCRRDLSARANNSSRKAGANLDISTSYVLHLPAMAHRTS